MLTDERIFTFSDLENEQYDLQTFFTQYSLPGAVDALNDYSCHSQQHVTEVMHESDMLLSAAWDYLHQRFPEAEYEWVRNHLLLAAKLHDIGMCGTLEQRRLLQLTDQLSVFVSSAGSPTDAFLSLAREADQLAQVAGMQSRCWRDWRYYCQLDASRLQMAQLKACLLLMHDDIKQTVRKRHALASGLYVLQHAQTFQAYYGSDISIIYVAVVAMMHSSFINNSVQVAPDSPDFEAIHSYLCKLIAQQTGASSCLLEPAMLRLLLMMGTLVRLADTRRSGVMTHALSKQPMRLKISDTGAVTVGILSEGGLFQPLMLTGSNEILAAEMCTEFGRVSFRHEASGLWHIEHTLMLRDAGNDLIQRIFADSRLYTYMSEAEEAGFAPEYGFAHTIRLQVACDTPSLAVEQLYQRILQVAWKAQYPFDLVIETKDTL